MSQQERPRFRPLDLRLRILVTDPPAEGKSETLGAAYRTHLRDHRLRLIEEAERRVFGFWQADDGGWYVQTIDADIDEPYGLPQWKAHASLLEGARLKAQHHAGTWPALLAGGGQVLPDSNTPDEAAAARAEHRKMQRARSRGGQARKPLPELAAVIEQHLQRDPTATNQTIWQAIGTDEFQTVYHDEQRAYVRDGERDRIIGRRAFDRYVTRARAALRSK